MKDIENNSCKIPMEELLANYVVKRRMFDLKMQNDIDKIIALYEKEKQKKSDENNDSDTDNDTNSN